ncbi:hypothetical protein AB835_08220 [Candidatus Endobugula sertula]|uniref:Uncharacterized protein n=1 Tax=Candidatus Endobugula sertula TaxID=62101 RepID=A0A1D2QPS1_9GAMM|nr:hypothetical protein AB835_08220 [Candidatus Endobugula sertula]
MYTTKRPEPFYGWGQLAQSYGCGRLHLTVLSSAKGYYIGTCDEDGPVSRESVEYYEMHSTAKAALEEQSWTQRLDA